MTDHFTLGAGVDAEIAGRVADRGFDLFCVADPQPGGRILHVGGRWEELLGHRPEALIGTSYIDLVFHEDLARVADEVDRIEAGGGFVPQFDVRLIAADGRAVWTRWSRVIDPIDGRLYAAARDVSVEYEAVHQLRFLHDLVERSAEAVTPVEALESAVRTICELQAWDYGEVWMPDGHQLRLVATAERGPGLTPLAERSRALRMGRGQGIPGVSWGERRVVFSSDVLDSAAFERRAWPEADGLRGAIAVPVLSGDDCAAVLVFMDRRPVPWDAGLARILRSATHHLGLVLGQLEARAAREEQVHELEESVGDLQSFVVTISHDVRAPLRLMGLRLGELLERSDLELPDAAWEALQRSRLDADRLVGLVDHLLAFSWADRQELQVEEVDVTALFHDVASSMPEGRDGVVAVDVSPLPRVVADPGLLRLAATNLVQNAVKYSAGVDEPRVEVTSCRAEGEVVYTVRDNGPGFDPGEADRIFGLFERCDTTGVEGSGVGLAIVERVVTRHGGRVWATSEPGRGAAFSMALPDRTSSTDPTEVRGA